MKNEELETGIDYSDYKKLESRERPHSEYSATLLLVLGTILVVLTVIQNACWEEQKREKAFEEKHESERLLEERCQRIFRKRTEKGIKRGDS